MYERMWGCEECEDVGCENVGSVEKWGCEDVKSNSAQTEQCVIIQYVTVAS